MGVISLDTDQDIIVSWDLCDGEPLCVPFCHAQCLTIVDAGEVGGQRNLEHLISILEQEYIVSMIPRRRT